MNYARVDSEGIVREIIPEFDPIFPNVPVTERFHKSIIETLVEIPEGINVEQHWTYNKETGFAAPVVHIEDVISEE